MPAYTNDDVQAAEQAIREHNEWSTNSTPDAPLCIATDILPVIAPAIAARALRKAADALPDITEGPDRIGTARWKQPARNGYSIAIEEARIALRAVADEIEGAN